jgi:hypothetical protein
VPAFGRIGLLSSLGHVHVAAFGYTSKAPAFHRPAPPAPAAVAGAIDRWSVSDPFPEDELGVALQSNGARGPSCARSPRALSTSLVSPARPTAGTPCSRGRRSRLMRSAPPSSRSASATASPST